MVVKVRSIKIATTSLLRPNVSDIVVRNGSCPAWRIGSAGVPNFICARGGIADTGDLRSSARDGVRVQVPPGAPYSKVKSHKRGAKQYEDYY